MRYLTINLVFILSSHYLFSQTNDLECHLNCESAILDSIKVDDHYEKYKVISMAKTPYASGEVLIPDWKVFNEKKEMIVKEIGRKYKVKELRVFRDCYARGIFYQALKPLPEQEKYLKENYITAYITE